MPQLHLLYGEVVRSMKQPLKGQKQSIIHTTKSINIKQKNIIINNTNI